MNTRQKFKRYIDDQKLCLSWTAELYNVYTFVWAPGPRVEMRLILTIDKKLADHHFGGAVESNLKAEINTAKTLAEL